MEHKENYDDLVVLYKLFGEKEELLSVFYDNDYPVPYKGLVLYPVQVNFYFYFHILVQCLLVPHHTSGDIKAITLSYFEYICYLAVKGQPQYLEMLHILLLIVLRRPIHFEENGQLTPCGIEIREKGNKWVLEIDGCEYSGSDFDRIRKIICEQNAVELPNENIHPDVLAALKEMEDYKARQCKVKMCTFGDQINIIVAKSSYKRDEVVRMTIRSFSRLLERVDKIMHYEIMTLLSPNMDKNARESIPHYMSASESEDKYKDIMIDLDAYRKDKGLS